MKLLTFVTIGVLCCGIEWTSWWLTLLSVAFCALYARAFWVAERKYQRIQRRHTEWVYSDHGWNREA